MSRRAAPRTCSCYRRGVWVTPPITENILEGITRETMMTLLRDELGQTVVERAIDRTELYSADELFLCGTGRADRPGGQRRPSPDWQRAGRPDDGPNQRLYFDVVRGNLARYAHWCSPAYKTGAAEHPDLSLHRNGHDAPTGSPVPAAIPA